MFTTEMVQCLFAWSVVSSRSRIAWGMSCQWKQDHWTLDTVHAHCPTCLLSVSPGIASSTCPSRQQLSISVFRVGNSSSIRKECPRIYQSESQLSHLSRILIRQTNALRYTYIYIRTSGRLFWKNRYILTAPSLFILKVLSISIESNKLDTVNKTQDLKTNF